MKKLPIIFFSFNRPENTRKVLLAIRDYKPTRLYLVLDGPRPWAPDDQALVLANVAVLKELTDWDCEITWMRSEENLGCGKRIASALSAIFAIEEYAVILEDDCVPVAQFFSFMEQHLHDSLRNKEVMQVSGSCFTADLLKDQNVNSPYMSRVVEMWGWGTWARAWKHYKYTLGPSDIQNAMTAYKTRVTQWSIREGLLTKALAAGSGAIDTWDYQWIHTIIAHDAYCITPNVSLIRNIGMGPDATHTTSLRDYSPYAGDIADLAGGEPVPVNLNVDEVHLARRHPVRVRAAIRYRILRKLNFTNL